MGSRGSDFENNLESRVTQMLNDHNEMEFSAKQIVEDAKTVKKWLKDQDKAEKSGNQVEFYGNNPFPEDSLRRLGRFANDHRNDDGEPKGGIGGFEVSNPRNMTKADYQKIESVLGVKLQPNSGKGNDSGEKKNISLKNLFGKKKPAEPKVNIESKGDSITMSNGEDSVSMKLKIPAMQGDFHYFEPTNAVWSSSDPEKAAKMYVEAKKGYSYRSGSNGKIEILTPKGYVDFEISKS